MPDSSPATAGSAPAPTPSRRPGDRPVHRVEALSEPDVEDILDLDQWAFGFDDTGVDSHPATQIFEWDRVYGVRDPDGDGLIGTNLTLSLDLPVPGGHLPCAGLTWVGVHPKARRQGVLSSMIAHHLRTVQERGEAVSVLYAAEAGIYGRFGYGLASRCQRFTLPRRAQLRDVPGWQDVRLRLERVDVDRHASLVADCHDAVRGDRPGMLSRSTPELRRHFLLDQPGLRQGAESLRIMTAQADDGGPVRGYALFRRKASWSHAGPDGTVEVRECVARDPAALRALWGRLVDLDLTSRVETWDQPLDDPLVHLLVDVRGALPRITDGLWLRIVDLPAALTARRYLRPVEAVLEVTDELCPWNAGRWRLQGGPDGAACVPTSAPVDLRLDVRELAAAYLGGESLAAVAAAGLAVPAEPQRLPELAAGFGWPLAPYNSWMF
ncbi:MAG TPA: GNAT family N-acetyltransferase [Kineosporiaceae bacterium]|nr:GNAT family N-acetyltransferase [Kineosporiaceae bacterium]